METNRRRMTRVPLGLPVRITGYEKQIGKWQELSETMDVSCSGVRLKLTRKVQRGQVLHLSLPLPWRMRQHGHGEPSYHVYALVQRILPTDQPGVKSLGLVFVGEYPPKSYLEKPWETYKPSAWKGEERRRSPREYRSEVAFVVYLDDAQREISQEVGQTVDVSRKGARICVQKPPEEFDLIKVIAPESNFESLGIVLGIRIGQAGFHHLNICWLGQEWPM